MKGVTAEAQGIHGSRELRRHFSRIVKTAVKDSKRKSCPHASRSFACPNIYSLNARSTLKSGLWMGVALTGCRRTASGPAGSLYNYLVAASPNCATHKYNKWNTYL